MIIYTLIILRIQILKEMHPTSLFSYDSKIILECGECPPLPMHFNNCVCLPACASKSSHKLTATNKFNSWWEQALLSSPRDPN